MEGPYSVMNEQMATSARYNNSSSRIAYGPTCREKLLGSVDPTLKAISSGWGHNVTSPNIQRNRRTAKVYCQGGLGTCLARREDSRLRGFGTKEEE